MKQLRLCVSSLLLLVGTALAAGAQGIVTPVAFGPVALGSSSVAAVTVMVANLKGTLLTGISVLTLGAPNQDFTYVAGGTCAVGSAYVSSCTVKVTFSPKYTGPRTGAVVLTDASGMAGTTFLRGTGSGAQAIYMGNAQAEPTPIPNGVKGNASGVAVDGGGNVYICDDMSEHMPAAGRVLKETLNVDGSYTESVLMTGLYLPTDIDVDGAGSVYVFDEGDVSKPLRYIYKLTPASNGTYKQALVVTPQAAAGVGGVSIGRMAVDATGNIFYVPNANTLSSAQLIYVSYLQADGTYPTINNALPAPDYGAALYDAACTVVSIDFVSVDGNGYPYYDGYVNCQNYTWAVYAVYSSGPSQPPTLVEALHQYKQQPMFLGSPTPTKADSRGAFYFLNAYSYTEEFAPATGVGYTSGWSPSSSVIAFDEDFDGAGNIYIADYGRTTGGPGGFVGGGVYKMTNGTPPKISFANTTPGATSSDSSKQSTVISIGNQPLTISAATFPKDFPQSSTNLSGFPACAANMSIATGSACASQINFSPVTALGTLTQQTLSGNVVLTANISGGSVTIPVTGIEVLPPTPAPTISPAGKTYTTAQSVTLSDANAGAVMYYTTDGTTPTASSRTYTGPIALSTNGTYVVQAVALAPNLSLSAVAGAQFIISQPADFTMTVSPMSLTINGGQTGSATATLTPQNGFIGTTTFACSGLVGATCSFTPATLTLAGTAAAATTVTITAPLNAALSPAEKPGSARGFDPLRGVAVAAVLGGLFLFRRRRSILPSMAGLLSVLVLAALSTVMGCSPGSSSSGSKHTAINGNVTITATSGSLVHTVTVAVTVP